MARVTAELFTTKRWHAELAGEARYTRFYAGHEAMTEGGETYILALGLRYR